MILHGTDTMAYTSSALSVMLENLTKPVILTGSQLPIGELRTDGKENMMTAIEIASMKDLEGHPLVPGSASSSMVSCCAAIVLRRSMQKDSMHSIPSTILISVM